MSGSSAILTILSIAAPIIAAISAIWGLTREASFKSETGEKRLTPAGRVLVALACISAMVAVTSIGFKALVDSSQEQRAGVERRAVAAQVQFDRARAKLDVARWRNLNARQQAALSELSIQATKQEAGRVVSNQHLLAAIEQQRDQSMADNARIFQIAQSQRIIFEGQPLGSLQINMIFGGFTSKEFNSLKDGIAQVLDYPNTDDEYYRLADSRRYYDDSNYYRRVFVPLLQMLMLKTDGPTETNNLILTIDIDGTGAWVLPIGVTDQSSARGLVFNGAWLYAGGNPNDLPTDDIKQEIGGCIVPRLSLNEHQKEVSININLEGNCLPFAIHRAGTATLTAKLTNSPTAVVYRNGNIMFPIKATNVADISDWIVQNCWTGGSYQKLERYIKILAIPNKKQDLAVDRTLKFVGVADMTFQPTYYDSREDWDAGSCAKFR